MKYLLFTIAFLLASNCLKAQGHFETTSGLTGAQGFPQPSVSNANTHGKIPVGLFTGTPNISIPLYEFQLKDGIRLPINLNYSINNVKPNSLPSEVGLGWSLECGGYITRVVKEKPDAYYGKPSDYRVITTEANIMTEASYVLHFPETSPNIPDEFQFNFLGYSGSFVYNIEKGKWMVQSDSDIKIEYTRITYKDTRPQISEPLERFYNYHNPQGNIFPHPFSYHLFDSFTLTTPDGYKYIFGGTNKTDYNLPFKGFLNNPTPITWHLSKIITPTNHEVEFFYETMPLQINGNMSFNISLEAVFRTTAMTYEYELLMPVQLAGVKDITDNKTLADFHYSRSTQLPYDSQYAWMTATENGPITFLTKEKNFILNQLSSMDILNKMNYQFTYTNSSTERLKLKTLTKTTQAGTRSTYSLDYYSRRLPGYNTGHYDNLGFYNGKDFSYYFTNDFFANAIDANKQVAEGKEYTNRRLGDRTGEYVKAEMLKSITYPTKGRTEFIYEPNVIASMVSVDRKSVQHARLPYPGTPDYTYPGGLRIKQIDNYDLTGELLARKHYYYTNDFTPTNRQGSSSGILSFTPQYLWGLRLYNLLRNQNGLSEYCSLNAIISQASNPLWFNSRGEYIGYSKVVECNEDAKGNLIDGYTVHTFSNFGPGYMDEDPIAMLNNKFSYDYPPHIGTPYSPFTPCSSNALLRGMLASTEQFDHAGIIKQKELFEYAPVQKDSILIMELAYSNVIDFNQDDTSLGNLRFAFGGTYYEKFYSNLLVEKQTINYDDKGNITEYKNRYEYDLINKQIKLETSEDGTGNIYEEKTRYVTDMLKYPNVAPYSFFYLINKLNFTNCPLEKTKTKNGKVIAGETYFYKFHDTNKNNLVKDKVYTLGQHSDAATYKGVHYEGNNLLADASNIPAMTYLAYDSYSNPTHIRNEKDKTETVYLYGYKGKYAIAEIKNSDYESVTGLLGNDLIKRLADATKPSYSDMQEVEDLRTQLPASFITTYEYIPYIGISKIRDPKNVSTYFKYDDSGRLIEKTDHKGELISSYKYSNNL
ncbi:hypothetical protein HCH04_13500 [Bacteroides thetaiotaomicron]|uniref:hypothetical protein n=1 Tax=Bacteroides thetaiotaomicron TaxID=818 RepID=UPI001C8C8F7F|nr:hypothetical protein [Bacteroides thetaiotaomicron]MBX9049331.1 hypothetical protein [Bacteroides thetaiotaomicron]MBX9072756.1 hypothetical protein [Bacteroides thetaiotaomicron]